MLQYLELMLSFMLWWHGKGWLKNCRLYRIHKSFTRLPCMKTFWYYNLQTLTLLLEQHVCLSRRWTLFPLATQQCIAEQYKRYGGRIEKNFFSSIYKQQYNVKILYPLKNVKLFLKYCRRSYVDETKTNQLYKRKNFITLYVLYI